MPPPETPGRPLSAAGLTRVYGPVRALDDVDLDLERGEFLTIFGPNGAGKSTLLKVLACLVRPTAGRLSIFGLDPRAASDTVKRRLGLIAHAGLLYGGLSARANLLFYARLYDLADPARRADEMLEEVGLSDRAGDLARTLSRGMKQRLSIARALIHDPDLVLLDEPYTGLDQHSSRTLRGILETVRGKGRTVVMVTHQLEEGLHASTRVAVMSRGRVAWESPAGGLTHESLARRYHEVIEAGAP